MNRVINIARLEETVEVTRLINSIFPSPGCTDRISNGDGMKTGQVR